MRKRNFQHNQPLLHEVMISVLSQFPNRAGTSRQISNTIREQHLYRKYTDGDFPTSSQISARVSKYTELFKRLRDKRIQLI